MILKSVVIIPFVVALLGCATSSQNLNRVSVGMTKPQVIAALGHPESTRANMNDEYLIYTLGERIDSGEIFGLAQIKGQYFVKLVDGRVVSYGKMGDFDSTKPFETKHEVDLNVTEK